jgi:hypothetical protein
MERKTRLSALYGLYDISVVRLTRLALGTLSLVSSTGPAGLRQDENDAGRREHVRAAVTHALDTDIAAADRLLAETDRPLRDRLIEAFDHWTGRYIGPMTKDVVILIENNPDLLGPISTEYPRRFAKMVTDALAADTSADRAGVAIDVARTLLSTANGIKHEASTREEFLARMTIATDLLLPALIAAPGPLAGH